jgi:hypothetical protein
LRRSVKAPLELIEIDSGASQRSFDESRSGDNRFKLKFECWDFVRIRCGESGVDKVGGGRSHRFLR